MSKAEQIARAALGLATIIGLAVMVAHTLLVWAAQ